ncbi:MAG TPA: hypothetical protein VKT73_15675 [Xanthobacteraceae bacterium]|nr:hypothetical protein [Xanthobacteraceae bacterium]
MGMVLRFPTERARPAPAQIFDEEQEPARILILPTVRIERSEPATAGLDDNFSGEPGTAGGRRRKRTPRD